MSMTSHAQVQIAAPAATVFAWLVEPAKLTQWAGGAGAMPADPSQLHVGYQAAFTMATPGGQRPASLSVTQCQPPNALAFTIAYDGGQSTTAYQLSELSGATTLTCDTSSDFAAPDLSAVEAQTAGEPLLIRWIVHHELQRAEHMLASGGFDAQTQPYLQAALQQSLDRLAAFVTGVAPPAVGAPTAG